VSGQCFLSGVADLVGYRDAPDELAALGVVAADGSVRDLKPAVIPAVAGTVVHQGASGLGEGRGDNVNAGVLLDDINARVLLLGHG